MSTRSSESVTLCTIPGRIVLLFWIMIVALKDWFICIPKSYTIFMGKGLNDDGQHFHQIFSKTNFSNQWTQKDVTYDVENVDSCLGQT